MPKILSTRVLHSGWTKLLLATIRRPDGTEFTREIEDHGRAAAVLPYDPERRTAMLVRLIRAPVLYAAGEADLLEAPAGMVEEDDPAETVRREAMEEVGLRLETLEHVATAWSTPGTSTERIDLYLAPYAAADRVAEGGGIHDEGIAVVETPLAELWSLAEAGQVTDLKTLALVMALKQRRPEAFG
jgi:nudix-type nucleoside diphosphatase (YffH/AdpP family)